MKFFLVAILLVFSSVADLTIGHNVSETVLADLQKEICRAEGIVFAIEEDDMSYIRERLTTTTLIKDLNSVYYRCRQDLATYDKLPKWMLKFFSGFTEKKSFCSKMVDASAKIIADLLNSIRVGPEGEENYERANKFIEEHCH